MQNDLFALLVHDRPYPWELLESTLKRLSNSVTSVRTCEEAGSFIGLLHPHLVFTDTHLPDGSWLDILEMAGKADVPLNVIVVNATTNTRLYVSAIERGAFDFVVPPFELEGLEYVVRVAAWDVRNRRDLLVHAVV